MRILFIIAFGSVFSFVNAQFRPLSDIHDTINSDLSIFLEKNGFGKVTYYYDAVAKKEGVWNFYPMIKLSESLIAVWVSSIPNLERRYSFLLFYNRNNGQFSDTLGPYFDSGINAIKVKIKKSNVYYVKVRLSNPPEPEDPRYTIKEYRRINGILKEEKCYNRK